MADTPFLRHLWESHYCDQQRLIWPFFCDDVTRVSVYHTGSLSAFLQQKFGEEVSVRGVRGAKVKPTSEERAALGRSRCSFRVREVELSVGGATRVVARTVMEAHNICLQLSQSIMHDYSSPIGRLLYSDRCARSTLVGFKSFLTPDFCGVGRRRVIDYRDYRLCVTEFFPVQQVS